MTIFSIIFIIYFFIVWHFFIGMRSGIIVKILGSFVSFFLTFWATMFVCCLSFALMMLLFSNFYSFNINI
ncbi:MAG: hypothetical protein Q8883_02275, partial [Sweet potato little leaf phytoplasma]|nr:hypothetical protein [Sweet potato little leaf phytoplasma]